MQQKLIIVCNDTEKKYATYLQQLISAQDDEDGAQVGTKDGAVTAAIFSEKQYADNLAQLNSTNFILFIGNSNAAKIARANMEERYSECGMHYGWLGRQAYMYADASELSRNDTEKFQEICEQYGKAFTMDLAESNDNRLAVQKAYEEGEGIVKFAAGVAKLALGTIGVAAEIAKDLTFEVFQKKDVHDQQYTLLTLILYMDGLSDFLGA